MGIKGSVLGVAIAAGAAMLVGLVALWLHKPPPPPAEPLVFAISSSTLGTPFWVAEQEGFFAAEGLAVELRRYPTGKLALEATLRGAAEVATVAETPIMLAALEGHPLRIIASYASSGETSIVARADRGISRPADLKGHRIGLPLGTTAHYFLHVVLTDQGLAESDVEIVPLKATEQAAALASGQIDAASAFAPYSTQCRRALGDKAVSFPAGLRYTGYAALVVAPDFPDRRPEATLRLLRATERAIAWIRDNRDAAIALAAREQQTDRALVEETWDRQRLNLAMDQGFVSLLQSEARWAIAVGVAPGGRIPDFRELVDVKALARLHPESVTIVGQP